MKKIIVLLLIITFGLISSTHVYAQGKNEKIAYVDLTRVFDEYKKTQKYEKELKQRGKTKASEREKKVREIKELQDKLSVLSKTEKEKTQNKIDKKLRELQEFDSQIQTDLRIERDNMLKEILKEIEKSISEYAQKNNYTLILNDRILLYGDKTLDITDDIIKMLNERYK
jgi:outer membrane protein